MMKSTLITIFSNTRFYLLILNAKLSKGLFINRTPCIPRKLHIEPNVPLDIKGFVHKKKEHPLYLEIFSLNQISR